MTATEEFAAFRAKRERERAALEESYISWRKVELPGLPPGHAGGYIARNDELRAYVRPLRPGGPYEYGRLVDRELVPAGTERMLHDAKTRAFEIVRESKEERNVTATAKKPAAETSIEDVRAALIDAIVEAALPEAVDGEIAIQWNKTHRYETLKIGGHAFGLVFAPGKTSVGVKIPSGSRTKKLSVPKSAKFAESAYGWRRSVSTEKEIPAVAKVFAAAAAAVAASLVVETEAA